MVLLKGFSHKREGKERAREEKESDLFFFEFFFFLPLPSPRLDFQPFCALAFSENRTPSNG